MPFTEGMGKMIDNMPEGQTQHEPQLPARRVDITPIDGKVVLQFDTPSNYAAYDPAEAVRVAEAMIRCAVDCGAKVTINTPPPRIIPAFRERAVARTLMLLRNKRDTAENDNILATRLVDTIINMLGL